MKSIFSPESEEGKAVNITWKDDDEFKVFGGYTWGNGETKIVKDVDWWTVRKGVLGYLMDVGYYASSNSSVNSSTFTSKDGITIRVQFNNDYLQIGDKLGADEDVPPLE